MNIADSKPVETTKIKPKQEFFYDNTYFAELEGWTKLSFPVISWLCLKYAPPEAEKGLDLGCGRGVYLGALQKFCRYVFGLDISFESLKASKGCGYAGFALAEAVKMPFADDSLDYVFSTEVLEHIENYRGMINEISRILRKNGRVFVTTTSYTRYGYKFFQSAVKDIYLRRIDSKRFIKSAFNYFAGFTNEKRRRNFIMKEIFMQTGGHFHGFCPIKLFDEFMHAGFSIIRTGYFRVENPIKLLSSGNIRPDTHLGKKLLLLPFAPLIKILNFLILKLGGYRSNIFIAAEKI